MHREPSTRQKIMRQRRSQAYFYPEGLKKVSANLDGVELIGVAIKKN